ncbi:MAG: DnaJ domain-containing protein [Candidatus Lambdaproteobacteria bacterium]|nr:DnaJ domain-containing protein [Candidatus Lambdaproteobacteria bacterium]
MSEAELRVALTPHDTWTDPHLRRLIHRIQCQPLAPPQRQAIYGLFGSDYVRATARHMMDAIATEAFWKKPPPELEALEARLIAFARAMRDQARRLGAYVSRDAFDERGPASPHARRRPRPGWAAAPEPRGGRQHEATHFATLGLRPGATLNDVKMAYREKVKQHHPDQGGTVQDFLKLQEAYEFLLMHVY